MIDWRENIPYFWVCPKCAHIRRMHGNPCQLAEETIKRKREDTEKREFQSRGECG